MTDRKDNPKGVNPCTHEIRKYLAPEEEMTILGKVYKPTYGSTWYQYEWKFVVPFGLVLPSYEAHLGALSGIKSLAIARVPRYQKSQLEAFVSLGEMTGLANSTTAKASAALARYGALLYRTASLKKTLTRDGKRALEFLAKKLKPTSVKEAWKTVLDCVGTASAADMEWKYGLSPMLQDIRKANEAAQMIGQIRTKLLEGVRVYGRATEVRDSVMSLYNVYLGDADGGLTVRFYTTKRTKTTATASILRKLSSLDQTNNIDWFNGLEVVREMNGLDPTLKGAWALLPLTFISDWFWNVSQLLESLESLETPASNQISSIDGMYTTKVATTLTSRAVILDHSGGQIATSGVGSSLYETYSRQLDPLTGGPTLYIPPLTLPSSASKWWSMAQIGYQQLLNRR